MVRQVHAMPVQQEFVGALVVRHFESPHVRDRQAVAVALEPSHPKRSATLQ